MGICISYKGSLSDPATLDEALREIGEFCHTAGWECHDFSEHYSGVVLSSQAEADGDAPIQHDPEPWPERPEGHGGLRRIVREPKNVDRLLQSLGLDVSDDAKVEFDVPIGAPSPPKKTRKTPLN